MTLAAADATPGMSPVMAALILGAMAGVLVVVFARVLTAARSARSELRRCPVCHGDALREVRDERLSEVSAEVSLQCGECSTWRRLVANHADFAWEVKALDRDRLSVRKAHPHRVLRGGLLAYPQRRPQPVYR